MQKGKGHLCNSEKFRLFSKWEFNLCMLVPVFIIIYFIRNLILHLPIFSTIQKPYYRQSVDFTIAGFADAVRPEKFSGVHLKRWQVKVRL
jgi:hypothetical protein